MTARLRRIGPAPLVGAGLLGAVLLLSGCGGSAAGQDGAGGDQGGRPDGRLVMVSGRDDHGLLAQESVQVYGAPGGTDPVGRIADGTLVHVTGIEGTWLRVATAEGRAVQGWVDDYFLRGEVRVVGAPPTCTSRIAGEVVEGGTPVMVTAVRGAQALVTTPSGDGLRGWVPRADLQELPPQGSDCGEDPPGAQHTH